jgi:replication-associated recombination protein RarA
MSTGEIQEDEPVNTGGKRMVGKNQLTRIRTIQSVLEESHLIGREKEKGDIVSLVLNKLGQQFHVISVWGMGGIGKTTLIKDVCQKPELSDRFDKRAFVTVMRPLHIEKLLTDLVKQLEPSEKKHATEVKELDNKLTRLLETKKCLIVVDDVSSTAEWTEVRKHLPARMEYTSRIIVTTRDYDIAKHCSAAEQENIYKLKLLEHNDARDLLAKKVRITYIEIGCLYHICNLHQAFMHQMNR